MTELHYIDDILLSVSPRMWMSAGALATFNPILEKFEDFNTALPADQRGWETATDSPTSGAILKDGLSIGRCLHFSELAGIQRQLSFPSLAAGYYNSVSFNLKIPSTNDATDSLTVAIGPSSGTGSDAEVIFTSLPSVSFSSAYGKYSATIDSAKLDKQISVLIGFRFCQPAGRDGGDVWIDGDRVLSFDARHDLDDDSIIPAPPKYFRVIFK